MKSQDADDLRPFCVQIERSTNVEKVQPELMGVDTNDPQQHFSIFLDVPSLSNEDDTLCLQKMEYILLRNELSYCMQTLQSAKNPPNHPAGN